MAQDPDLPFWSAEAYLEQEEASNTRHEFLDGVILAMAGGSRRHGTLIMNLGASLHGQLRDSPCQVFSQDIRLANPLSNSYFYPDLFVESSEGNARLVIEVLSPATEATDRDFKRRAYRASPAILDYLMVRQDQIWIEHDTRLDGGVDWTSRVYSRAGDVISLPSIGCVLTLGEIYRRVELD